jgi:hypothetical protein
MLISSLTGGTEVIILKGEGSPPVQQETCTVIWKVNGFSALTAEGIALSCQNVSDLIVTGNKYETYHVTAEALQIWGAAYAAKKAEEALEAAENNTESPDPTRKFRGGDWDKLAPEPE